MRNWLLQEVVAPEIVVTMIAQPAAERTSKTGR